MIPTGRYKISVVNKKVTPRFSEEQKKASRKRIMESAQDLFSTKGYHETSMDDIVEKSGLSKGAIYGHFKSKDELFMAVRLRHQKAFFKKLVDTFGQDDSALLKLDKTYDSIFCCDTKNAGGDGYKKIKENSTINLEFIMHASRTDSLKEGVEEIAATGHKFIGDIFNDGVENGEFRDDIDINSVTSIFDAILDGLAMHWVVGKEIDWDEIKKTLDIMFREGIVSR